MGCSFTYLPLTAKKSRESWERSPSRKICWTVRPDSAARCSQSPEDVGPQLCRSTRCASDQKRRGSRLPLTGPGYPVLIPKAGNTARPFDYSNAAYTHERQTTRRYWEAVSMWQRASIHLEPPSRPVCVGTSFSWYRRRVPTYHRVWFASLVSRHASRERGQQPCPAQVG